MVTVMKYEDYQALFKSDLVVAVRKLLEKIDDQGDRDLEDSPEHNALKGYFNKYALHKKINKEEFKTWQQD